MLVSLGEIPGGQDHSIFLLIQGLTACLALLILAAFYVGFIVDAVRISAGNHGGGHQEIVPGTHSILNAHRALWHIYFLIAHLIRV